MEKAKEILEAEARIGEPIESFITRRYKQDNISGNRIAKELGLHYSTIYGWMDEIGLERRDKVLSMAPHLKSLPTRKELEHLYYDLDWTYAKIGGNYGVSFVTARTWLINADIPLKEKRKKKDWNGIPRNRKKHKNTRWKDLSNEDFIHYMRSNFYGYGITEFADENLPLYFQVSQRGLLDFFTSEGTLIRIDEGKFRTYKEWRDFGLEKKFEERNPQSFKKSEDEEERAWHSRGARMNKNQKWIERFPFKRKRLTKLAYITWRKEGLAKNYNRRTQASLINSENPEEKRWIQRGNYFGKNKDWVKNFPFAKKEYTSSKISCEKLTELYQKQDLSIRQIAKRLEVSRTIVYGLMRKYEIGLKSKRISRIYSDNEFKDILHQDPQLPPLIAAAGMLNGHGADIEKIIFDIYEGKFKNAEELHRLIQDNYEEARKIIREGRTNLGYFVGDFTVTEGPAMPVFIDEAIELIPIEKISGPIEDRFVRVLRSVYGPKFNDNPAGTLEEISKKASPENQAKSRILYERLYGHYSKVMEAMSESI